MSAPSFGNMKKESPSLSHQLLVPARSPWSVPSEDVSRSTGANKELQDPGYGHAEGPSLSFEPSHSLEPVASFQAPAMFESKPSPSASPPPEQRNGKRSTSSSMPPQTPRPGKKAPTPVQLIGYLPIARAEAMAEFTEMEDNWYQYKSLGKSREMQESMTCDCVFDPAVDPPEVACGHDSDCINRLTQVECLPGDCRCKAFCQNQRFQKRQYGHIDIVKTDMKGYGLRAEEDIPRDTFIYEYVGDVVSTASFQKRMRDYASEGIRHFYFMMLQKDEFIDATKNGGIGRFANHSCNPNCYVAKWTVGKFVRMGIFAKRNIQKHEELTFNYNVDRYGHEAQTCYCGEPNCVGVIGGKTQTDMATMDDLYFDALGITDPADLAVLKGTKKQKGKKLDDPDFMPKATAIFPKEVPKVIQALGQVSRRKILLILLHRIKATEDPNPLRQLMRLRGFSVMKNLLEDNQDDPEVLALTMESMLRWPLEFLNKVEDSQIRIPVEKLAEREDEVVKSAAQALLDQWSTLLLAYRIPKRAGEVSQTYQTVQLYEDDPNVMELRFAPVDHNDLGDNRGTLSKADLDALLRQNDELKQRRKTSEARLFKGPGVQRLLRSSPPITNFQKEMKKHTISAMVAEAQRKAEAEARAAEEAAKMRVVDEEEKAKAKAARRAARKAKALKKPQTPEEKEKNKEKRLLKLVGAVVVKSMSKYARSMDHATFKKHAKELTHIIAEKEKKSKSWKENRLDSFSDEKAVKIKKFSREYIEKVVRRLEEKAKKRSSGPEGAVPTPSTSADTPSSVEPAQDMTVEEAMDMEGDSDDSDSDEEMDEDEPPEGSHANAVGEPGSLEFQMDVDSDCRDRPPDEGSFMGEMEVAS